MKFYLPILLLLLVSVTSIHKRRKDIIKTFLHNKGLYYHSDNSVWVKLPGQEDKEIVFTFNGVTEQGIVLERTSVGGLPAEYAPYFQTKKLFFGALIPFPYIRSILSENNGHPAKNLHINVSPNLATREAKISIYLPKERREEIIQKVKEGAEKARVVGYLIQVSTRLQLLDEQFKEECSPINSVKHLQSFIVSLIQKAKKMKKTLTSDNPEQIRLSYFKTLKNTVAPNEFSGKCLNGFKNFFGIAEMKVEMTIKEKKYVIVEFGEKIMTQSIQMLENYYYPGYTGQFNNKNTQEIYDFINKLFPKDKFVDTKFDIKGNQLP